VRHLCTKMNIDYIFQQLGYGKREASVYCACIKLGKATATDLQKKTKFSRSTIYYSLELLMNNNIVSIINDDKKKYYIAEDPENIKNLLEDKKNAIILSLEKLKMKMPELKNVLSERKEEALVKYYAGIKAIANLHVNMYRKHQNQCALLFSSKQDENSKHFKKVFRNALEERIKNNIHIKGISPVTNTKFQMRGSDQVQLRESRFLPEEHFSFKSDLMIFEDAVLCQTYVDSQPIAAVLCDQNMVATMKMIFELAWEAAEKYDKQITQKNKKGI